MAEQDSREDSVENSVSIVRHKIIFVGDAGVGKTSIIARIIDNPFSDSYEMSIGVDFCSKNIRYRGQNIKLQIWDSAGQEKYKGLIPSYVRNSAIVFIVYDVGNKESFGNIPKWITFIKTIENTTLVLCGNKIDLQQREVTVEDGEELAKKEGIAFFEVSAKTNMNIKNMFYTVVADLPSFSDTENKENLIKELEEENGVETIKEGNVPGAENQMGTGELNIGGQITKPENLQGKKKGCAC